MFKHASGTQSSVPILPNIICTCASTHLPPLPPRNMRIGARTIRAPTTPQNINLFELSLEFVFIIASRARFHCLTLHIPPPRRRYNQVGDAGATALAPALAPITALQMLNLQ